jgi:hypothetical protein
MIVIPASDTIAGSAPSGANEVTCTLHLLELNTSTGAETFTRDQQQLAAAAATIYTATADGPTMVKSISVVNTDAANASTFQLFVGGTAAANAITPVITLPKGGCAIYENGWRIYSSDGKVVKRLAFQRIEVQRFINAGAGTYTPTAGMKACIVVATGGGGGGGGADTSAGGSADVGVGGGGGAGGTAIGFYTAAQVGTSKAFSVGSAGSAGSNAGGNGTAGGNTTWNTTDLVGTGGALGTGSGSTTQDAQTTAGGLGGVPTGGIVNVTGGSGQPGIAGSIDGTTDLVWAHSGRGGASFWGDGGRANAAAQASLTTDATAAGGAGLAYGAGGAGGHDLTTATGVAGGAGMTGIVMVIEFIG